LCEVYRAGNKTIVNLNMTSQCASGAIKIIYRYQGYIYYNYNL